MVYKSWNLCLYGGNFIRKRWLILFLTVLLSFVTVFVWADVPTVTETQVEAIAEGSVLTITIRHGGPTSAHYVSEIEVKEGDDVVVIELDPQSTVTFTEEVEVSLGGDLQVRAYCTLHGWSAWKSVETDSTEPPIDDAPSGGIPGFPLLTIGIGLTLFTLRRDG